MIALLRKLVRLARMQLDNEARVDAIAHKVETAVRRQKETDAAVDKGLAAVALAQRRQNVLTQQVTLLRTWIEARHTHKNFRSDCSACVLLAEVDRVKKAEFQVVDA